MYKNLLKDCSSEIDEFRQTCQLANIPEIKSKKTLRGILEWTLNALKSMKPKIIYKMPDNSGELEFDLGMDLTSSGKKDTSKNGESNLPRYMKKLKHDIENILGKSKLNIWIMIDKLDEIFPRRSDLEIRALRGLLRTMRIFSSEQIRIKIFFRDDMLAEIVSGDKGFTALTHITARKADTLRWSEEQILTMIVNRLFTCEPLSTFLQIDQEKIKASQNYREIAFYKVFPSQVHKGSRESSTLRWIYNHTADGNKVVTPRDVIELLKKAIQKQLDVLIPNPSGVSESIIGSQAIIYGYEELSKNKRITYLQAEFPHLWKHIEKFQGCKTDYSEKSLKKLLGADWQSIVKDLQSIGLMSKSLSKGEISYGIPFLYRKGLDLTQGRHT